MDALVQRCLHGISIAGQPTGQHARKGDAREEVRADGLQVARQPGAAQALSLEAKEDVQSRRKVPLASCLEKPAVKWSELPIADCCVQAGRIALWRAVRAKASPPPAAGGTGTATSAPLATDGRMPGPMWMELLPGARLRHSASLVAKASRRRGSRHPCA